VGQKLVLVVAPQQSQHPVWADSPWQLKHIHGRDCSDTKPGLTVSSTMPFAAAFIVVFRDILFYFILTSGKKK